MDPTTQLVGACLIRGPNRTCFRESYHLHGRGCDYNLALSTCWRDCPSIHGWFDQSMGSWTHSAKDELIFHVITHEADP